MISFKEYCEEWIGLNRWQDDEGKYHSTPLERQDYYKLHMNGASIQEAYDQLVKCETFNRTI